MIDRTKQAVFSQIDSFFDQIIEIARERKEKLKNEYLQIETKERGHFAVSLEKVKFDSGDLQQISQAFNQFYTCFGKSVLSLEQTIWVVGFLDMLVYTDN